MSQSPIEFGQAEGALKAISARVDEARQEFEQHAKTLDGQIQALKGKWVGQGGNAFAILHAAWIEKHAGVTAALNKFQAALTETEADNVATDEAAGGEMNKLYNKLGSLG